MSKPKKKKKEKYRQFVVCWSSQDKSGKGYEYMFWGLIRTG